MKPFFPMLFALSVMPGLALPVWAQSEETRTEQVHFAAGATGTTIEDSITGRDSVLYKIGAEAGQDMNVTLTSDNTAAYFNVYSPGNGPGDEALAAGSMTGPMMPDLNSFRGTLPQSGEYTVSVYLYRNAARRNEAANYTLDISIAGETGAVVQTAFAPASTGSRPRGSTCPPTTTRRTLPT